MSDPIWLSTTKALATPIIKIVGFVHERLRRPAIKLSRAPENIFEYVRPGVSVMRMRELLGQPHRENNGQYCYSYSDACVQIDSADGVSIDATSVGLTKLGWRREFHIWPMKNLVLGKTRFRDVVEQDFKIESSMSSKEYHFYVVRYYGFPGLYCAYGLGVLECPGVYNGGSDWSPWKQSIAEIPEDLRINWACVTRLERPAAFNYYGFL